MDNKHKKTVSSDTTDENTLLTFDDGNNDEILNYVDDLFNYDSDEEEDDIEDEDENVDEDEEEDDEDDDKDDEVEDEFDSIVKILIDSSENISHNEENELNEKLMEDLLYQKIGKEEFMLPRQSTPALSCSDITLRIDDNSKIEVSGQPLAIEYDSSHKTFNFTLNNATLLTDEECYLYVYAKSYPQSTTPICIERIIFDRERECATVKVDAVDLYEGSNLFLFDRVTTSNKHFELFGNSICFPMHFYDNDYMFAPTIAKTDVSITPDHKELSFRLKFQKCIASTLVGFNLDIYNSNLNLVAQTSNTSWHYNYSRDRQVFDFTAISNITFAGRHLAILSTNGYPTHCLYFNVDKNGISVENNIFTETDLSLNRIIIKLTQSKQWNELSKICGYGNAKELLFEVDLQDMFNEIRCHNRLTKLEVNHNIIYHGGCSDEERKMLEKVLYSFNNITSVKEGDCISLCEAKAACDPYEDATSLFGETYNTAILLYNISQLVNGNSAVVNKLAEALKEKDNHAVCLIGSKGEIEQLFQVYPKLKEHFPESNTIERYTFTANDYIRHCITTLRSYDLNPTRQAIEKIENSIEKAFGNGYLFGWTLKDVDKFTKNNIIDNFYSRQRNKLKKNNNLTSKMISTIEADDIDTSVIDSKSATPFEESIKELNEMVGLQEIKSRITTTFNRIKVSEERKRLGLKVNSDGCNHMIFTGNPGTGKTTVAKMVGKIYHSLGLLSKGEVICADRPKIVGRYIGETERNMQRLLSEAKGNVLFIDEAYSLCDTLEDRKDFGYRAIECLLTVLSQKDSDIIVIFAGYEKDIEKMMESNLGLSGRFPYKFIFKDYSAQELTQIALNLLGKEDYILSPDAEELLTNTIEDTVKKKNKNFSNARWIEQYVDKGIKHAQSDRLAQSNNVPTVESYRLIEVEDVRVAFETHKPKEEVKQRAIGFIA